MASSTTATTTQKNTHGMDQAVPQREDPHKLRAREVHDTQGDGGTQMVITLEQ
jgi:hypothetical protein